MFIVVALLVGWLGAPAAAQNTKAAMQQDPACQSLTAVSAGGPVPKDPNTVVVRWLSFTNYELAYGNNVFLLDAYIEQTSGRQPIGMKVDDIRRADAIFIGHSHFDHVADAPIIAKRTGATVVGAQIGNQAYLTKSGVQAKQFKAVKSGDTLRFSGVTVEAVQGTHNSITALGIPADYVTKQRHAIEIASLRKPPTDTEKARDAEIEMRGDTDPRVDSEGVIDYLFTFGNDFRVMFIDSNGGITNSQRQLSQRVPSVDVALLPYLFFDAGIPALTDLVKLLRPSTVFLGNQDGIGTMGWASNYPPALAIRDVSPKTRTMDVIYRTPVCFNTQSKEMVIGW
jgi:hypothetical protein